MVAVLGDGYAVKLDPYQYLLCKKRKIRTDRKGDGWEAIGFYADLGALLNRLARDRIGDTETIAEHLAELRSITEELRDAVAG